MDGLLPWLAAVGLGMLHGLSPTSGWTLAAGRGLQAGCATRAWRALGPIALGHLASIAAVAGAVAAGLAPDRTLLQPLAGLVLLGTAVLQLRGSVRPCMRPCTRHGTRTRGRPAGHGGAALAAWSALMASAHGAGLVLVPALAPLCLTDGAAPVPLAADALLPAAAALGAHLAAMLLTAGMLATGVCRAAGRRALAAGALPHRACALASALGGLWLVIGSLRP